MTPVGLRSRISVSSRAIYALILVLVAVGPPSLLRFGTEAIAGVGLLNVSSLIRIGLYLLAGYALALVWLAERALHGASPRNSLSGVKLVALLYVYFLATAAITLSGTSFLTAAYRVYEWLLLLLAIAAATPNAVYAESRQHAERHATRLLMWILSVPAAVVLAGVAVAPDFAVHIGPNFVRLGGWLYGPNGLGVACGMGSVLFWALARTWVGKSWAVVLFACLALTYSRGAYVGFAAAMVVGGLFGVSKPRQVVTLLAGMILLPAVYLLFFEFEPVFEFFSRGQSFDQLATLNSRSLIWAATLDLLEEHWLLGTGYTVGPKVVLAEYFEWFLPATAHNDLLNALLAGGVAAAALVATFYVLLAKGIVTAPLAPAERRAYAMIAVQAFVYSLITPLLTSTVFAVSATVLVIFRHTSRLRDEVPRRNLHLRQSTITPELNPGFAQSS